MNLNRNILVALLLLCVGVMVHAQHLGSDYRLKRIIPVMGRQGIAVDEHFYYVSDSKALYKYDKNGNLLTVNKKPFVELKLNANHIGDIDVWNGELYAGVEWFDNGGAKNIQIAVFDANTLQFKHAIEWNAVSGQTEVSGIAVDKKRNMVWMSDWSDSRYVYCYSLETGKYYTKMQCRPTPYWCQGLFIADSKMLFSADDGDSTFQIPDCIYCADISYVPYSGIKDGHAAGAIAGKLNLFREMNDFVRTGEIEGLSIDPVNDDLVVLNNRGLQIVNGMPKEPYIDEGYSTEIHELYIYEKLK